MYRFIATVVLVILLCGCGRHTNSLPKEIIKVDADIKEAEELLYKAWKPAYDMTTDGITIPRVKIKNLEELLGMYDFSYVDEHLVDNIYFRSLASYDDDNEMEIDADGFIIFDADRYNMYTPTIYDERVRIVDAYYEEKIYEDDFSYRNSTLLVIREESFDEEDELLGFYRTNYFEEDDSGRWILTSFSGVGSQTPSSP